MDLSIISISIAGVALVSAIVLVTLFIIFFKKNKFSLMDILKLKDDVQDLIGKIDEFINSDLNSIKSIPNELKEIKEKLNGLSGLDFDIMYREVDELKEELKKLENFIKK